MATLRQEATKLAIKDAWISIRDSIFQAADSLQ